ncbi:MAG: hypothetical protein IT337_17665 [Thermomicrobiales bacterium]|nr:hypothetical protein [Thermomicrobiales bacterium]
MALMLAGGMFAGVGANAKGDGAALGCECGVIEGPAVVIDGGSVSNQTNIQVSANAGTAISDASGGSNNVGVTGGGLGDVAAVGQGGGADAQANGGAVSLGDINSGSNAGNAITVGNTIACKPCPEAKPIKEAPIKAAPVAEAPVVALPSTGVGGIDAGILSALAAAGAAGAAGLGLRRRS